MTNGSGAYTPMFMRHRRFRPHGPAMWGNHFSAFALAEIKGRIMMMKTFISAAFLLVLTAGQANAATSAGSTAPALPAMRLPLTSAPATGNMSPSAPIGGNTPAFNSTAPSDGIGNTNSSNINSSNINPGNTNPMGTTTAPGVSPCNSASNSAGTLPSNRLPNNNGLSSNDMGPVAGTNPDDETSENMNSMTPSAGVPGNAGIPNNAGSLAGTAPAPGAPPCD